MTTGVFWSIPGVGVFHAHFDRIEIVSTASVGALKRLLPMEELQGAAASVTIVTWKGPDPRLRSRIKVVCADELGPLRILAQHEAALGNYRITQVEIALDPPEDTRSGATGTARALVMKTTKLRHRRGHLRSVYKRDRPPPGCLPEPTVYYENRGSSVRLKNYSRLQKFAGGDFGEPHARLEWTISGKPAIVRYFGGNTIDHLLTADLDAFIDRNLRLEEVDHVTLGYMLQRVAASRRRRKQPAQPGNAAKSILDQFRDPDYWARRVAFQALRWLAYREQENLGGDFQQALWICQNSPAQIRGYLKELRDRTPPTRRGRPKNIRHRRKPITDYMINRCFRRIKPTRV
jgi:hypothetical protein